MASSVARLAHAALGLVLVASGCAGDAHEDASSENVEALVEPTTHVIDARPGIDVEVTGDALVFHGANHDLRDDVAKAAIGDVLVSGHGEGFCRRITGRRDEGSDVVITTSRAGLTD